MLSFRGSTFAVLSIYSATEESMKPICIIMMDSSLRSE